MHGSSGGVGLATAPAYPTAKGIHMPDEDTPKPTCFVIQTFDGGKYDRRYRETIYPALIKADVVPQRADEILGLNPIIEKIESAIKSASICIAEVSDDNPNVWLELGYALALNRPAVILCDKSIRARLPFDVQHRPVILYRTDSRSGFDELESNIVKWVRNELKSDRRLKNVPVLKPGSENKSDLEDYEVEILSTIFAFWPTPIGGISYWDLKNKLQSSGFAEVAIAMGISELLDRGYVSEKLQTEDGGNEFYELKYYFVTKDGIRWLQMNRCVLTMRENLAASPENTAEDDIPF